MSTSQQNSGITIRMSMVRWVVMIALALLCLGAWVMPIRLSTPSLTTSAARSQGFGVTCAPLWRSGGSRDLSAYDDDDHGGVSAAQDQLMVDKENPYTSTQMWDEIHRSCSRARQNRQTWLVVLLVITASAVVGRRPRTR